MVKNELTLEEEKELREHARHTFKLGDEINPEWHPIYRDECSKISAEVRTPENSESPFGGIDVETAKDYVNGLRKADEVETESYHVRLELTVDASLFDDAAQVELWVENQLSKKPDVASAMAIFAETL